MSVQTDVYLAALALLESLEQNDPEGADWDSIDTLSIALREALHNAHAEQAIEAEGDHGG